MHRSLLFCFVFVTFRFSLEDDVWDLGELANNKVVVSCVKSRGGGLLYQEALPPPPGTQVDGKWKGFPEEKKSTWGKENGVPAKSNPSYFFVDQKNFYAKGISN